ncbi:MAG: Rid family detoxifying hydrolase [Candidatus Methylomirabilales bacterium]
MDKQVIRTEKAPIPTVPISQAIKANGMIYCSGFVPSDPVTGKLVGGDIEAQAARVLENLKAVLESAGSSLDRVVKTTVFLADRRDFPGMNAVYGRYFPKDPPARSTVEARLMIDAKVEIELIALA